MVYSNLRYPLKHQFVLATDSTGVERAKHSGKVYRIIKRVWLCYNARLSTFSGEVGYSFIKGYPLSHARLIII